MLPASDTDATRSRGFILGRGAAGRCDDAANGNPIVKWHPGERCWWMWYYCRDRAWPRDVAPALGTGRMALAKSADGIRWERFDGPLTGGAIMEPAADPDAFDCTHIGSGDISFHEGEWILWYFGGDSTVPREIAGQATPPNYHFKGYRCRPGVARSRDGIQWHRVPGTATGGAALEVGDYIYGAFPNSVHDGRRFLLYCTMLAPALLYWETHVAESTDLIHWRPLGPLRWETEPAIWESGGSVTRHIIPNPDSTGPRWLMTYTAVDARVSHYPRMIAAAVSDDGLLWRRLYDEPILHPGPLDAWDGGGTAYPHLVPMGSGLHLYYYGFRHPLSPYDPARGIGLARSEDGDLRHFRKVLP
jgi:hypothetical protein